MSIPHHTELSEVEQVNERRVSLLWLFSVVLCIGVILWGAFVRFSRSGDGCGVSWPLCDGQIIPNATETATMIEYFHRLTSGLFGILVLGLCIHSLLTRKSRPFQLRFAVASLVFTVTEALIGAGLVLREMVGDNTSIERAMWLSGHLANTLLLLGFLTGGWCQARHPQERLPLFPRKENLTALGLFIFLAITGSLASLSNSLYPSEGLVSGLQADLSPESPLLVSIRIFHPLVACLFAGYGILWARRFDKCFLPVARRLSFSILAQFALGLLTLLLLSPMTLKLAHLLLADGIWVQMIWLSLRPTIPRNKQQNSDKTSQEK